MSAVKLWQPEDRKAGSDTRQIPPTCITRNRTAIFFPFALPQIQVTREFWRAAFTHYISATTCFCVLLVNFQDYYGLCQYRNSLLVLQLWALWLANQRQKCYQALITLPSNDINEPSTDNIAIAIPGHMGRPRWGEQGKGLGLQMGIPLGTTQCLYPAFFWPPRGIQLLLLQAAEPSCWPSWQAGAASCPQTVLYTQQQTETWQPLHSAPTPKALLASSPAHPSPFMGILQGQQRSLLSLQRILI